MKQDNIYNLKKVIFHWTHLFKKFTMSAYKDKMKNFSSPSFDLYIFCGFDKMYCFLKKKRIHYVSSNTE